MGNSESPLSPLTPSPLPFLGGLGSAPSQVRGELLRERVQRLEAQEGRFAESLVALQFQKATQATETLAAYSALLSIQDLLLEELGESGTLTKAACAQVLESHSPVSVVPAEVGGGGAFYVTPEQASVAQLV